VAADAHGERGRWLHPIFAADRTEAGCGTCHSGIDLPLPETVEDADEVTAEFGCLECHQEGRERVPSLDAIALRGVPEDWLGRHRGLIPPGDSPPLSVIAVSDLEVLNAWLQTRVGAPHLARGKMVFQQLGCMGCHRRGAVGGDIGPELTRIGDTDARELSEEEGSDSATLPRWLRQHLLTPQELVENSKMPLVDVEEVERESDIDDLVTYLLSLRGQVVPPTLTPPDRARVVFGLGRDFPTSGRGLFQTFCSSCHGTEGEGREMETLQMVTPMIGTRGVLSVVTPRYLRASILSGRRGRYMPAWGPEDGGLSLSEIEAMVDHLASQAFPVRPFETLPKGADVENGRQVFVERCAFCHTKTEHGPSFGSDLLDEETLRFLSDRVLYGAITRGWVEEGMPSFSFLPASELRDLVAFLQRRSVAFAGETAVADGLHSHLGHQIWTVKCGGCHGVSGEGGEGPMLNTEPYLVWADDPYLAGRIRNHRGSQARAEIGNPSGDDLDALLDYMRGWSGRIAPAPTPVPDPDAVVRGRALYPPRCTECHGERGRGKTGTALASPEFLSVVTRPFLVMTILEGRKGTPMKPWRIQKEMPVSLQDAYDLADYVLSLGLAEPDPSPALSASLDNAEAKEIQP
jgi:mono/diheme cytochrome c family protein